MPPTSQKRRWLLVIAAILAPAILLEIMRTVSGAPFQLTGSLLRLAWVAAVLGLGWAGQARPTASWRWSVPTWTAVLLPVGAAVWAVALIFENTPAAWLALAITYALVLAHLAPLTSARRWPFRWLLTGGLALAMGALPVLVNQVQVRFSDEEFFAGLQALGLACFFLVLVAAWKILTRELVSPIQRGPIFSRAFPIGGLISLAIGGVAVAFPAYQASFYPQQAPSFPGISAETPFLCGTAAASTRTYDGQAVFEGILARVAANPNAGTPEYGMLALATGEPEWQGRFHDALLADSTQGLYTGPANSIKFGQYEAALRVYYYVRAREAFPTLFTPSEQGQIQKWLAAVNRRSMTVEWVDWLYASALGKWPLGPYENQENGAGLLALLQSTSLADPSLSLANQAYLDADPRGFTARFRNTDDALKYQPEWINNAYFQSLAEGMVVTGNVERAFEWLLLQALPDGAPMSYNPSSHYSLAPAAYFGASLLGNGQLLWLSGSELQALLPERDYLYAQPGLERALNLTAVPPTTGSCLLYGDSGLPTRAGPLAPDKIVFRGGWDANSPYLMLDLRFTGWHRYKATNAVTLVYQQGDLAAEQFEGQTFSWLPSGRAQFRDKRVPRENLNGFLVGRTGLDALLYALTGLDGPWAQDPPFYASVDSFTTAANMDSSVTTLSGWHGWDQHRSIFFYHDGPIVILDDAAGPRDGKAAISWQLPGAQSVAPGRFRLDSSDTPAEVLLLPQPGGSIDSQPTGSLSQVRYTAPSDGYLRLVTVFLAGPPWVGAQVALDGDTLTLTQITGETLTLSLTTLRTAP